MQLHYRPASMPCHDRRTYMLEIPTSRHSVQRGKAAIWLSRMQGFNHVSTSAVRPGCDFRITFSAVSGFGMPGALRVNACLRISISGP
jgi:hypothetical protein